MTKIKDAISKKGMTIEAVANNMGISKQAFCQLLQREDDLQEETLQRVADAIGCDISELKKSGRGGYRGGVRPMTDRKIPLMVRISQEAADKIATVKNKSEYVDGLIRADNNG